MLVIVLLFFGLAMDSGIVMMENGACYINSVGNILNDKNRLSGKISVYPMPEYTAVEIDEPDDFLLVENLMKKYNE